MASGRLVIEITETKRIVVYVESPPSPETILGFIPAEGQTMKYRPILAPITDTTVTSRPVLISFNGGAPSVTVDMIDPTASFEVPAGETGWTGIPTGSINPVGVGPAGAPFPFAIIVVPPGLPVAEVITGFEPVT